MIVTLKTGLMSEGHFIGF